jgi:actin-like ATPase involved in cell morphogenesis
MAYYLGVDMGTTYTAAAVWRDGRYEIASLGNRAPTVPSVILLRDDAVLTGEAAARRAATEPSNVAREFKRRIGDPTPVIVAGSPYSADALMAKLLRWVVDQVTRVEGGPPAGIAVSHPANWGAYKLDLLRQAIRLADLDGVATLTEPESAAIHYAQQERVEPGSVIAVYDLGGGTFDAAVLRKTATGWEILGAPEGIERLGGVDFDAAVYNHVLQATGNAVDDLDPDDPTAQAAVARLRDECIEAKEVLSTDSDVSIPVMLPNRQTQVRLTRAEYETMVRPVLSQTITALNRALRSAKVAPEDVTSVLLVGGSSRTPLVAEMVSSAVGRPVAVDAHPKYGVALGAAITAAAHASGEVPAPTAGATASATPAGPDRPRSYAVAGLPEVPPPPARVPAVTPAAAGLASDDAGAGSAAALDEAPASAAPAAPPVPADPSPDAAGPRAATDDPPADASPDAAAPAPAPDSSAAPRRRTGERSAGLTRDPRSILVPYGAGQAPPPRGASQPAAPDGDKPTDSGRHRSENAGRPAGGWPRRPRHRAAAAGGAGPPRSRRIVAMVAGGLVLAGVLGVGAAFALTGDEYGSDGQGGGATTRGETGASGGQTQPTQAAAAPTEATTTTTAPPPGPEEPFVRLDSVEVDEATGRYRADYEPLGFVPQMHDGAPHDALHVHLFFDTQPAAYAGTNGPEGSDWYATGEPNWDVTKYTPADAAAAGATQLCSAVANNHEIVEPDRLTGTCVPLPPD